MKGNLLKLDLIRKRLELVHDNTDLINNYSVKHKPFTNANHPKSNLKPNSSKFYVSDPNLIHKPECTNPNNDNVRPSTSYYIPTNLNNQVEANIKPKSSHSTPHTLYLNITVKPPGTPHPKTQVENSVKVDSNPITVLMHS